jgi:hypothetical protein
VEEDENAIGKALPVKRVMAPLLSYSIRIHRCRLFRNDILAFYNQGKIEEVTVKSFDTIEKRMLFVAGIDFSSHFYGRNTENAIT